MEYLTTSTKVFRENSFLNMESYAPAIVKNILCISFLSRYCVKISI
jgi:hypothetical protein